MWRKAQVKVEKRIMQWRQLHPGMLFSVLAYNHHILPVLSYIAQLVPPSTAVLKMMDAAVAKLFPGPGNWLTPGMARSLKHYGLANQLVDLALVSMASMQRYYQQTALNIDELSTDMYLQQSAYCKLPGCNKEFADWHRAAFSLNVACSTVHCADNGVSQKQLQAWIFEKAGRKKKPGLQKLITRKLHEHKYGPATAIEALRRRLRRWRLELNLRMATDIVLKNMDVIARTCRPCVQAAYLRTILNGWVTKRRMRFLKGFAPGGGPCVFNCGHGSDCIEHYAFCRIIVSFFRRAGISYRTPSVSSFLMVARRMARDKISVQAACLYAIYLSHNILRCSADDHPSEERVAGLLRASFARSGGMRRSRT